MSYPAYPEYKDSGIEWLGEVPAHWEVLPFFSRFLENRRSNKGMVEDNLLSLSYGRVVKKDINTLDGLLPESFETYQIINPDDIIFRLTDLQNDKRSLRSAISKERGIITSAYLSVRSRDVDARFSSYLFRAYDLTKVFYAMGGGLRQSMKYGDMKWIPVLTPPESEQIKIATFLDHETARIDALVEEQQRLIELLKEKRQAVISHAVTKGLDPNVPMKDSRVEWLGEVPEHWGVSRLKYITKQIIDCPHETPVYDPDGEFLVVRTADLQYGILDPRHMYRLDEEQYNVRTRRSVLDCGDIVYGREGERWGHAALVPERDKYCLGQRMMQFIPSHEICSEFLMWQLNSNNVYRQGSVDVVGATSPHVNVSTIKNYFIAVPARSEQSIIAKFLNEESTAFDELIHSANTTVELLYERRSALISAAVTGKIDVRGWKPPADSALATGEATQMEAV
ncbi:MAG: restriction endonuclease subunit S [Pseudomonadota bacterium]